MSQTPRETRTALYRRTRAVAEGFAQLIGLGAAYRRAAWGPGGEPNRASEALLALERARAELEKAVACYAPPSVALTKGDQS